MIIFRHDILKSKIVSDLALQRLRRFITHNEGELISFLVNMWNYEGQAITYKELRESFLYGALSEELFKEWRRDYARFVTEHLYPKWQEAMKAANEDLFRRYPDFYFDPTHEGLTKWNQERAAAFVTRETDATIQGLRAVIRRASELDGMNVDELGRVIRPMVGLNHRQINANINYYKKMIEDGVKPEKAYEKSVRYTARQHRYRGQMIARTELAFSYNHGLLLGVKQAQEQGLLGKCVKVWSTSGLEADVVDGKKLGGVCDYCKDLAGKIVDLDGEFEFHTNIKDRIVHQAPPAHPHCMCALVIREIEPPIEAADNRLQ